MRAVWRYALVSGDQTIEIPQPARLLTATVQADDVLLYALADPAGTQRQRVEVRVLGTGHDAPDDLDTFGYVATATMPTKWGSLVWHVFARWTELVGGND